MVVERILAVLLMAGSTIGYASAQAVPPAKASASQSDWVGRSNQYTHQLLYIQFKYSPEDGSEQGIAKFDTLITDPTGAAELAQRKELEQVLARIRRESAGEKSPEVREDLAIIEKTFHLQFRREDYRLAHKVPFIDASAAVFGGIRTLLDDQVAAERADPPPSSASRSMRAWSPARNPSLTC